MRSTSRDFFVTKKEIVMFIKNGNLSEKNYIHYFL